MSQVPQIRVMAAKARGAGRGSELPTRDTIAQIVPHALLTQTSRSILYVSSGAQHARCHKFNIAQVPIGYEKGISEENGCGRNQSPRRRALELGVNVNRTRLQGLVEFTRDRALITASGLKLECGYYIPE